jgi:hypothetical protein
MVMADDSLKNNEAILKFASLSIAIGLRYGVVNENTSDQSLGP